MIETDILIIGGGPAGISAAIWSQRLGLDYLLIEKKEKLGGQLADIHNRIIDYPGSIYENGQELQEYFIEHIDTLQCQYHMQMSIQHLDLVTRTAHLIGRVDTVQLHYRYLILATGTSVRRLEIPGELEMIERGEIYSATKDRHRFHEKKVAVIGGGDRAFEGALLLAESGADVYLVHRASQFRAREEFRNAVFNHSKIKVVQNSTVEKILHTNKGIVGIDLQNRLENTSSHLPVEGVFIRIGVQPNAQYVKEHIILDEDGYVHVDTCQRTTDPTIYAIGDVCTHPLFSSISSASAQGMIAAKHLSLQLS